MGAGGADENASSTADQAKDAAVTTLSAVPSQDRLAGASLPTSPREIKTLKEFFSSTRQNESVVLEWENLNYSTFVKVPKQGPRRKDILTNVSGHATSGELLAIMGPTGCGKTSLMNILAARVPSGGAATQQLTGTVRVNGETRNEGKFRDISAYVLQDDFLYAHLTVHETVLLAAHFFLPSTMPNQDKLDLVDVVIAELGLRKARDTIIGDEKARGVSGGERKRANIAVQESFIQTRTALQLCPNRL